MGSILTNVTLIASTIIVAITCIFYITVRRAEIVWWTAEGKSIAEAFRRHREWREQHIDHRLDHLGELDREQLAVLREAVESWAREGDYVIWRSEQWHRFAPGVVRNNTRVL